VAALLLLMIIAMIIMVLVIVKLWRQVHNMKRQNENHSNPAYDYESLDVPTQRVGLKPYQFDKFIDAFIILETDSHILLSKRATVQDPLNSVIL